MVILDLEEVNGQFTTTVRQQHQIADLAPKIICQ